MNEDHLHPTVREFRSFINKHPKLITNIRKSGASWQEYYEKWVLLGEDDPMWEQYKEEKDIKMKKDEGNKSELFSHILALTANMDIDKIQNHVQQLSHTISTVQEMLGVFQQGKETPPAQPDHPQPFHLFRD